MNGLSCHAEQFDFILQIMRSDTDFERPRILLGECSGEKNISLFSHNREKCGGRKTYEGLMQ